MGCAFQDELQRCKLSSSRPSAWVISFGNRAGLDLDRRGAEHSARRIIHQIQKKNIRDMDWRMHPSIPAHDAAWGWVPTDCPVFGEGTAGTTTATSLLVDANTDTNMLVGMNTVSSAVCDSLQQARALLEAAQGTKRGVDGGAEVAEDEGVNALDDDDVDVDDDNEDDDITSIRAAMDKGRQRLQQAMQAYTTQTSVVGDCRAQLCAIERALASARRASAELAAVAGPADAACVPQLRQSGETVERAMDGVFAKLNGRLREEQGKLRGTERVLQGLVDVYNVVRRSNAALCPVCLQDDVQQYVVPCGHTFCNKCLMRDPPRCYVCRAQLAGKHNLFFA